MSKALDLTKEFPRSPRVALGGYVVAARTLDKCRSVIAGTNGDYHYDCPLDNFFFDFAGLDSDAFKKFVETGADDKAVGEWIKENSKQEKDEEVIIWNNSLRYKRISEMPEELQVFIEGYVEEFIPADKIIYHWFDIYDIEEGRI